MKQALHTTIESTRSLEDSSPVQSGDQETPSILCLMRSILLRETITRTLDTTRVPWEQINLISSSIILQYLLWPCTRVDRRLCIRIGSLLKSCYLGTTQLARLDGKSKKNSICKSSKRAPAFFSSSCNSFLS